MATFKPIAINRTGVNLPYKDGQYIVATQPFTDGVTTYQAGVYVDMLGARQQLTMTGPKGDKGDPGIGNATLSNTDGDSTTDGFTQAAVKGIAQAKNYYNLGAFDTFVSNGDGTGTVTVNTQIERFDGSENWDYNESYNGRFYLYLKQECTASVITQTKQFTKMNQSLNLGTHEEDNSLYVASKVVYIRYDAANGNISEFKKWLSQNPLVFEYATVNSYSYKVIDAQSIRPANQEECFYWNEEWEKGLNLCPLKQVPIGVATNVASLTAGTYSVSLGTTNGDHSYSVSFVNEQGAVTSLASDFTNKAITFSTTQKGTIRLFINGNIGDMSIMLNKGTRVYPYEPYSGRIIHEKDLSGIQLFPTDVNPAQTIGGDWEDLGTVTTSNSTTLHAYRRL